MHTSMKELEMRFRYELKDAPFVYSDVYVELRSQKSGDNERLELTPINFYFSRHFKHATSVDPKPKPDNDVLETGINDTIFAVFRNEGNSGSPKLPMDTIEIRIPITDSNNIVTDKAINLEKVQYDNVKMVHKTNSLNLYAPLISPHSITIIDLQGKKVAALITNPLNHWYTLPKPIANGIYLITLRTKDRIVHKKMYILP